MLAPFPLNPILPAQDGPRTEAFCRDVLVLRGNILALNEIVG